MATASKKRKTKKVNDLLSGWAVPDYEQEWTSTSDEAKLNELFTAGWQFSQALTLNRGSNNNSLAAFGACTKPIHTEANHKAALAEIERLWDAAPGTPDFEKFEVLATLVDAYERQHTPILPPDPVEAIKFRLEQQGQTRKALEPIIGTRARVSEVYPLFLLYREKKAT